MTSFLKVNYRPGEVFIMTRSAKWTGYGRVLKLKTEDSGFTVELDGSPMGYFEELHIANAVFTGTINRIRDEQTNKRT